MRFTIELRNSLDRYRLQNDGSWRLLSSDANGYEYRLDPSDFTTDDPREIERRSQGGNTIELAGQELLLNPRSLSMADFGRAAFWQSAVFRRNFPRTPTLEDLRATIAITPDDDMRNLVLLLDGSFAAWRSEDHDYSSHLPTYVVRSEAYVPGNGYLGLDAARDDAYVAGLYRDFLEEWVVNLRYGFTQEMLEEGGASDSLELLEQQIDELRRSFRPHF